MDGDTSIMGVKRGGGYGNYVKAGVSRSVKQGEVNRTCLLGYSLKYFWATCFGFLAWSEEFKTLS